MVFYFDIHYAVKVHDWIIEQSGGVFGIQNIGLLESALEHIQNDDYYPELHHKLTHLVFAINKFHAFTDGNKRSSIALGAYLLQINGYEFAIQKFVLEMENIAVWLADGKISKELLTELIESILFEDDFSEALKLKLVLAVNIEEP
ncbi:type II toxin-antitoxin system death-on-curing family toxin [Alkalinema sp. FACHB-956]|uniref:type II toxin-antitoxin system death-on-curing family toxin n=1 Tax=Alkalinema sp. FACHB-956 TaxID=2692768 RepID=UPI001687092F|nr:type II toxin-antitoxin system death-on-curing family toxin [Alkalinema sp. FACHB-956]MBD2328488.1 type II toxin-antitoxin system death-on-curing family toxin [Alkalinema sp. FACHB-956]